MTFNDNTGQDLLKGLASDYADYLVVDTTEEHSKLSQTITNLTSNLEEFSSLLDSINLDTTLCVDSLLPQINTHYQQVKETFRQIDKLEAVVSVVGKTVTLMEQEMNNAEATLGQESFHVLKSVFRPFMKSSTPKTCTLPASYTKVDIFEPDDLLNSDQPK